MNKARVMIEAAMQARNLAVQQNRFKYCNNCGERDKQKGEWKEVDYGEAHERICTHCHENLDRQPLPF